VRITSKKKGQLAKQNKGPSLSSKIADVALEFGRLHRPSENQLFGPF
jgi:hypothetical protein